MPKKFDGVIFDIDGTLTFTNQLIFDSFNHIAEKYLNTKFSDKEIIGLFGPPEDEILEELCGDKFEDAKNDYYEYYKSNHKIASLYPGIKELIKFLKEQDVLLSIFTGKGRRASLITLKEMGVLNYFDMIVTGDEVENHKPSADGINLFLKKFNLDPEKVLMIGDSVSDIKASRQAGVEIASVVWDSYGKTEVEKLNPGNVFHSVDELRKYIEENISG